MFQTLDEKGSCVGIYQEGELYFKEFNGTLDKTWNYVDFLKGQDIEYAQIYAQGSSLEDVCPIHLQSNLKNINNRLKAFINSFIESKVSLKENCFFDLVPQRFLKEYCEVKNKISQYVFENYARPTEYKFYREFTELITKISKNTLEIDKNKLSQKLYHPQGKKLWEKVNNQNLKIKYNIFSSITGRLTLTENSFPILTLPAGYREIIKPKNDWFVALDLNAAEMRVALALAGQNQPTGDLHEDVRKQVFGEDVTRTQAKNISTQWLYNARNEDVLKYDDKLSLYYNKEKIFSEFWKDGAVTTPFSRKIECDAHHVISYICQSTLIDLFHRQLIKISHYLENKKSFIAFMIHDCVVFDISDEEKHILPDLIKIISDTQFGYFPAKVEIGPNFGDMKKVNIKV